MGKEHGENWAKEKLKTWASECDGMGDSRTKEQI